MLIGIPKEIKNNENRVGLTPAGVQSLGELRCLCAEGGRAFHGQPYGDTAATAGILCQCRKGTGCR